MKVRKIMKFCLILGLIIILFLLSNVINLFFHYIGYYMYLGLETDKQIPITLHGYVFYRFVNPDSTLFNSFSEPLGLTIEEQNTMHFYAILLEFIIVILFILHRKTLFFGLILLDNFILNSLKEYGITINIIVVVFISILLLLSAYILYKKGS